MTNSASPKHPRASHFEKAGLFRGIKRFSQLEEAISKLETTEERGAAFEVFAEAYFSTYTQAQAVHVWAGENVPVEVRDKLRLSSKDMGVDGIFEDALGNFSAYQVKYRKERRPLTWKSDLATFFGLADAVGTRVVFTNSNDLPKIVEGRASYFCIRGSDLDRLEARDFDAIDAWIKGSVVERKAREPWPCQADALKSIAEGLESNDRVTAVMACGTGKTLVALWLAEAMQCRSVLVLVPSLALMRQTLHTWLRETSWARISYRCVCSDASVTKGAEQFGGNKAADEMIVRQADLDFPVNTESKEVAEYLARPFDGTRVVFSTYQSAQVVAEALDGFGAFDLGIFDEAHKTAGGAATKFSFAIKDENLPITKRLFLTATPRHYDVSRRDKEGDAKLVYSMDDTESYGPTVHTLNFAEAARQGIICNYKVVISVVTSEMVTDALLRRGEVNVDGDQVKARQVANQIALEKAVAEHGIKRIFTFHSTVASAKSFVAEGGEGIGKHLPGFDTFHVNGAMRTADREDYLRGFAEADRGLITNARCLTEGVDVPAVDMVAFMSPKKSRIDIAQATGRAMRKDPNDPEKMTGFVLVPLFVEMAAAESIEDALERTGFDEVWNVLEAMQEQDDVLKEVIRQMREDKGRAGGFDDSRFREKVEVLGPSIGIDELRSAISSQCIERLAAVWDERFGELQQFKEDQGHCNVPAESRENPQLSRWVSKQRQGRKEGILSDDRFAHLEALGFVWDTLDAAWDEMFAALEAYKAQHDHCNVPRHWRTNSQLASWLTRQRASYRSGNLSDDHIARLDKIGVVWDPHDSMWEEKFAALQAYKVKHGHCNVPQRYADDQELATWVNNQRRLKQRDELSDDRVRRLDALGFAWGPRATKWEEMFAVLEVYKSKYRNVNVPSDWPENPELGKWVAKQRKRGNEGTLSEERIERLEALGFVWNKLDAAWDEMFAALEAYKAQHGDCNVPQGWPENRPLGTWVAQQRLNHKRGKLSDELVARLEALGFVWNTLEAAWEEMFAALQLYKAQYGDCMVPQKWSDNAKLGRWVSTQRVCFKKGQLNEERIARLDALGFRW